MTTHHKLDEGPYGAAIEIHRDGDVVNSPDDASVSLWVSTALSDWSRPEVLVPELPVVGIRITGESEARALNHHWRGRDYPTNVLSFPSEVAGFLGDIALCAPVIEQEAKTHKKSSQAHWAHLVIHGVLHLRGHDHETKASANVMERQEIEKLQTLGFDNPYVMEEGTVDK